MRYFILAVFLVALSFYLLQGMAFASSFQCKPGNELKADQFGQVMSRIEDRYQQVRDMTAQFSQQSFSLGMNQTRASRGEVRFKTPGMMHWEYESPNTEHFVTDGVEFWHYQQQDDHRQVMVGDFKQAFHSDVPVSFLLGLSRLGESYRIIKACPLEGELLVELESSKDESHLEGFFLLVSASDYSPLGARVIEVGGNETTILLENRKYNQGLKSELFTFKIPTGTDIIRQEPQVETTSLVGKVSNPAQESSSTVEKDLLGDGKKVIGE